MPSRQREAFRQLLDGYVTCASRAWPAASERKVRLRETYTELLDGFADVHRKAQQEEHAAVRKMKKDFGPILDGFEAALEQFWKRQEATADDFNLLAVVDLESDELSHTKVLAWLLNGDPRVKGTHYQRSLGFRCFLETFSTLGLDPCYADSSYQVRLEVPGKESRLDIQVASVAPPSRFLIGIEVKIKAPEREKQTQDEWSDLWARAKMEAIPDEHVHAFFLTPEGIQAQEREHFRSITWRQIAAVFRMFGARAQPADVRLFAQHCARAMERLAPAQIEETEE